MFPSWTKKLIGRVAILGSMCVLILGGVWVASGGFGQALPTQSVVDDSIQPGKNANATEMEKTTQPKGAAKSPLNGGADAKKDAAKIDPTSSPKEARLITLTEAIGLVEKAGKGEIIKGEKMGAGASAQFDVEVLGANAVKTRFNVNATGKVIVETPVIVAKKGGKKTPTGKKS